MQDNGQVHEEIVHMGRKQTGPLDGMVVIDILQRNKTVRNNQTVQFDMQHTCEELDAQEGGHVHDEGAQGDGEPSEVLITDIILERKL